MYIQSCNICTIYINVTHTLIQYIITTLNAIRMVYIQSIDSHVTTAPTEQVASAAGPARRTRGARSGEEVRRLQRSEEAEALGAATPAAAAVAGAIE